MRQACAADAKVFCAQVKTGEGRLLNCFETHLKDLFDECYDRLEKRAQPHKGGTQYGSACECHDGVTSSSEIEIHPDAVRDAAYDPGARGGLEDCV
jgi:hypothetical protein